MARVPGSKLRMPRSHRMTPGAPPSSRYSAAASHSSTVAPKPRLSSTGRPARAAALSSDVAAMVRAPICTSSQCSATRATEASDVASRTTARPNVVGDAAQQRQAVVAEALEGVGRGARLEGAAAQEARAGLRARRRRRRRDRPRSRRRRGRASSVHSSPPTASGPTGVSTVTGPRAAATRGLRLVGRRGSTRRRRGRRCARRAASSSGACGPTTSTATRPEPRTRARAGAGAGQLGLDGARLGARGAGAQEHDHRSASTMAQTAKARLTQPLRSKKALFDARQIVGETMRCS